MSTPISLAALVIAVLVAYAAGQTDKTALFLQPTRVDADKAFDLEVVSFRWSCARHRFSMKRTRNWSTS